MPLTVIVAVRGDALVLAVAVSVTVPLPDPEMGETVNHAVPVLEIDQSVLDVMEKDFCSAADVKLTEEDETDNDKLMASCVTMMLWVIPPVVEPTVKVAVRCVVPVLAVDVNVIVPLPAPEE